MGGGASGYYDLGPKVYHDPKGPKSKKDAEKKWAAIGDPVG